MTSVACAAPGASFVDSIATRTDAPTARGTAAPANEGAPGAALWVPARFTAGDAERGRGGVQTKLPPGGQQCRALPSQKGSEEALVAEAADKPGHADM